jgi:hypothetical protein
MAELEKDVGNKTGDHANRINSAERMLKELGVTLDGKGHKSDIEKLEAVVLAGIDRRLTAVEEKHMRDFVKRLQDYEKKNMQEIDQVRGKMGDIDKALKECANIEHYLGLDRKHGLLSQQQAEIAQIFKENMQDVDGKIEAQRSSLDSAKAFLEQRMRQMEASLSNQSRVNDFMKDMEQRFLYLEEDQKRARSMLESSLQEQIRMDISAIHSQSGQIKEAWDREVRARQSYQENYQNLLAQERAARESQESVLGTRLENFERGIYSELQRVWQELGKEHAPIVIQQPPIVEKIVSPPIVEKFYSAAPQYAAPVTYAAPQYVTSSPKVMTGFSSMGGSFTTPIATTGSMTTAIPSTGQTYAMRSLFDGSTSSIRSAPIIGSTAMAPTLIEYETPGYIAAPVAYETFTAA